jgi:peptidoglycan/xylan/chitin deacetylase (PgdA/CDA1 family)
VTGFPPEPHLFIVWSRGRLRESEILADLAAKFEVVDVVEVSWSPADFSNNLTRFYGEALPSGSEKERHCGNGPFLVVIVRDPHPQLAARRPAGRLQVVDERTLDAKELYRSWTGGGHRVHATLEPREFAHDLFLLLGRHPADYDDVAAWNGVVTPWRHDLVGSHGWTNVEELLTALEVTVGRVALHEPVTPEEHRLALVVDDPWWAAVVANGRPGLRDPWAQAHEIDVAGDTWRLELESPGPSKAGTRREVISRLRARMIDFVQRLTSHKAGLALVYHRVGDPRGDALYELVPQLGLVEFANQLRVLKRRYRVVPASALPHAVAARRRGGRFPVAVTFDDSLVSHVRLAAPLLREADLPATFFVNGTAADARPFWWEELQRAVDRQTIDPRALPGVDSAEVVAARERQPGAVRQLASSIERTEPGRRRELAALLGRHGGGRLERRLTSDDVAALAGQGFEIGFHTLEHDLLPPLDDAALRRALTEGRSELEAAAGRPIRTLAYPHGKADARVAEAAREAGYDIAFVGSGQAVYEDAPPLLIPRWEPPFDGGAAFELAVARRLRS